MSGHSEPEPRATWALIGVAIALLTLTLGCGGSKTKTGEDLLSELDRVGLRSRGLPVLVFATSDP